MRLDKAIVSLQREMKQLIENGLEIKSVTAEDFEDNQILVCANNENGDAEVTIAVGRQDLLVQLVQLVFEQEARQIIALHKLEQIPTVQQSFPA